MKSIFALIFLVTCLTMAGCSNRTSSEVAQTLSDDAPSLEKNDPPLEMPLENGVFVGDVDHEIPAGNLERLMPTNAERGFGFGAPSGTQISQEAMNLTIFHTPLKTRQLQITFYRGIAVNAEAWGSDVNDSNVAWLPEHSVKFRARYDEDNPEFAQIEFREPLTLGFYVLHDDSLMRAEHKEDVTAYYPFVVTDKSQKPPWNADADACFKAFYDVMGSDLPLKTPQKIDRTSVVGCALKQRLAWKADSANDETCEKMRLRAIYLARLFDADNLDTQLLLRKYAKPLGKNLSDELWRIEQLDQIQRLDRIHAKLTAHEPIEPELLSSLHAYYQPQIVESDDERLKEPLMTLSWIPFVTLAATENRLQTLLDKTIHQTPWELELIEILGAMVFREILDIAQKNKTYVPWLKQVETRAPSSFRELATSLSFRRTPLTPVFGPYLFENVPEDEISAWRATLMVQAEEARDCFPQPYRGESAFFVLEQPLTKTSMVSQNFGVLHDPEDKHRSRPAIDPAIVQCVLKSFANVPSLPSLEREQKAFIAISVK